jgi:hypothetical protein
MSNIKTKKELEAKLKALGKLDDDTKKSVVCSLIGHSNIQKMCFGYVSCARCGTQVGDTLGGIYENKKQVVVGHNCEICRANYKELSWKDKYLCPDPFKVEEVSA